jgi:competence protein ComGC
MKQIAMIVTVLFFALVNVNAQTNSVNNNGHEEHIRKLIQNISSTYKLTGEQQIAVKTLASTTAENVKQNGSAKKEVLKNDFHVAVKKILTPEQYNHYINVQKQSVNPILDALIDSAKNGSK